jgi:hypothetical protein
MGLGPSWVALCLVNILSLDFAGIKAKSAVVCGDDAAAVATAHKLNKYH